MKLCMVLIALFPPLVFAKTPNIEIETKDSQSLKAKKTLEQLFKKHDLEDFVFTKKIVIESKVIPHSHPVLTLKAEEKDDPDILLGTFIHEQMHWYWIEKSAGPDKSPRVDFKLKYPNAPTDPPEGSGNADSTYQHIGICWLEYQGLVKIIGKERARKVLTDKKYYTWIYKTVLHDSDYIAEVMKKYGMPLPSQ